MRRILLEGNNVLLGRSRFLSFEVPDDWRIFPMGVVDVEVYKEIDGVNWVISGYITLGVIAGDREILLRIKVSNPFRKPDLNKFMKKHGRKKGSFKIAGHQGAYIVRKQRRGLIRERRLIELTMCFYCDKTRRKIDITIEAEKEEDVLMAMDVMLTASCHQNR